MPQFLSNLFNAFPRRNYLYHSALVVLILSVFGQVLGAGFIGDDWSVIVYNRQNLQDLTDIPDFFTSGVWEFTAQSLSGSSIYRPLWLTWNSLVYQLAGDSATAWHASNLVLHAVNSLLLFSILKRLFPTRSQLELFFFTALFAVHPVVATSVSWVSGSTDPLMLLFFLGAFYQYLAYCQPPSIFRFTGLVAFFVLALLTKEPAIILPFVLLAFEWSRSPEERHLRIPHYLILALVAFCYLAVRYVALEGTGSSGHMALTWESLLRALGYFFLYIRHLVFPWQAVFFNEHVALDALSLIDIAVGVFVAGALVAMMFIERKAIGGVVWIVMAFLPPLALAFHSNGYFALRFLYLSAGGLSLLAPVLLTRLPLWGIGRWIGLLIILVFGSLSYTASSIWKDETRLNQHILELSPHDMTARANLASHYQRNKDYSSAEAVYRAGLQEDLVVADRVDLMMRLARMHTKLKKYDSALQLYRKISEQKGFEDKAYHAAAHLFRTIGRQDLATPMFERLLSYQPENVEALYWTAVQAAQQNRIDQAIHRLNRIISLPENSQDQKYRREAVRLIKRLTAQ